MTFKNKVLHKLLFRRNDFCCLCFNPLIKDDYVEIDDGIIYNGDTINMADMIKFVVPTEVSFFYYYLIIQAFNYG